MSIPSIVVVGGVLSNHKSPTTTHSWACTTIHFFINKRKTIWKKGALSLSLSLSLFSSSLSLLIRLPLFVQLSFTIWTYYFMLFTNLAIKASTINPKVGHGEMSFSLLVFQVHRSTVTTQSKEELISVIQCDANPYLCRT